MAVSKIGLCIDTSVKIPSIERYIIVPLQGVVINSIENRSATLFLRRKKLQAAL